MVRATERVCGMPCNLRVAWYRAAQQNAAVKEAVLIAQEDRGLPLGARQGDPRLGRAGSSATVIAAAVREAAAARVRREAEAAAREAAAALEPCATQEAIAKKEAEVRALEEGLAQQKAPKGGVGKGSCQPREAGGLGDRTTEGRRREGQDRGGYQCP